MKKFFSLCISGLIGICLSMSLHAQSSQQDLDQVELAKQFIGSWTAETGVDSTVLWEVIPSGNGYTFNLYFKANGESYGTHKGIIGTPGKSETVTMVTMWQEGWITIDKAKFASDKKITFERFPQDLSHLTATLEMKFLTPNKFNFLYKERGMEETWDNAAVTEWTWTRVKK